MANPINTIMAFVVLGLLMLWLFMLMGGWDGPKGTK